MTVSNKPGHRGEREVSRKTIARGMPGRSGVTVVTTLVCFVLFCTRDCGRIARPAFPAPSEFSGTGLQSKPRAKAAASSRNRVSRPGLFNLAPLAGRGRRRSEAKSPGEGDYPRV